jgi:DNA polymerase elongation subunit (family B)
MWVRNIIKTKFEKNQKILKSQTLDFNLILENKEKKYIDLLDAITDIREYDVPYHCRVCIDKDIRAGLWYVISYQDGFIDSIK